MSLSVGVNRTCVLFCIQTNGFGLRAYLFVNVLTAYLEEILLDKILDKRENISISTML